MTDNNGLDVLIAWSIFGVFLIVLAAFVLRGHPDPIDEANRRTDGTSLDDRPDGEQPPG